VKEYLVFHLNPDVEHATRELNYAAVKGWRVVGTLYYGGVGSAVILERDRARP
jgi:hypothetical protein